MIKLALRNCLRNKRRTIITGLSMLVAVFVVIIIEAWMFSLIDDMTDNDRLFSIGDLRIRAEKYNEYESLMPIQFYIEDYQAFKEELLNRPEVDRVEAIINAYGSLYDNGTLNGVSVIGAEVGSVYIGDQTTVREGRLLEDGKREIMATPKLLDEYNLAVGDSITIIFKTVSGGSNAATFRIVAAVAYDNAEFNSALLVTSVSTLSSIMHIEDGAIEAHLYLKNGVDAADEAELLSEIYEYRELDIESWKDVSVIYSMIPMYYVMIAIIIILFFFIASTLVFNTMMMSTLERRKEISTMIALGFSRSYVMALFIVEGLIIALVSSVLSAIVSFIVISVFGRIGLDLTPFGADAVDGWGFPNVLYPHLKTYWYFIVVSGEVLVSVLASYLATKRVRRIEVAEALREEA